MDHFPGKTLLATDGSQDAILASRAALDLSNASGSELHVVHVQEPLPRYAYAGVTPEVYSFVQDQQDRRARQLLTEEVRRVRDNGGNVTEAHMRRGPIADEILDLAEDLGAGLIAIGSRGLGPVKRLVLGSVSEGVVHDATCPVLVVRGEESAWPPERLVIGDNGSEAAKGAGELAARIGKILGARALLVRVYPELPEIDVEGRELNARMIDDELSREQQALEDSAVEIERSLGIRPRVRIAVGDPAAELLEAAGEEVEEKTLIALGSRGLDAVQRMRLGSVSTKVLHAAKGPVLIYPRPRG